MCGIAGVLARCGELKDVHFERVESLVSALHHRGPDASAVKRVSKRCILGSTRLAITDHSNTSVDMPLASRNGRWTLVFNGEVYNFSKLQKQYLPELDSQSDTQVLIELIAKMGADCLNLLEGMFALLVHDRENDDLFFAADVSGQKTLYFYQDESSILFSSEIQPLITMPGLKRTVSIEMLAEAVARRFIIGTDTHVKEIRKIPSGCFGRVSSKGEIGISRYHSFPLVSQGDKHLASVVERFHVTMDEVAKEMFATDLPIALLLSGGIDSSSLAWMAQRYNDCVQAFSIGFEPCVGRTFEKDFKADEFSYSGFVAAHYGLPITNVRISQEKYFEHFEEWIDLMGEPRCFMDAPALLALFKEIGKTHKIAFCGSGTDEILDGYSHYDGLPYGVSVESRVGNDFDAVVECYFETDLRLYGVSLNELLPNHDVKSRVLQKLKDLTEEYRDSGVSGQQLVQLLMARSRLVHYEFCQVDLTSMHSSVEARSPYGERRFMEFAFSFAPELKAFEDNEKYILKQALKSRVPDRIIDRKKAPFPMPMQYFFSKTYENRVESYLGSDSPLARLGLVDPGCLERMWKHEDPQFRPVFARLYMLNRMLDSQKAHLDLPYVV